MAIYHSNSRGPCRTEDMNIVHIQNAIMLLHSKGFVSNSEHKLAMMNPNYTNRELIITKIPNRNLDVLYEELQRRKHNAPE